MSIVRVSHNGGWRPKCSRLFLPFLVRHPVPFVTTQSQFADLVQALVVLVQQLSESGAVKIEVKFAAPFQRFERANDPGRSAHLGVQQVQQVESSAPSRSRASSMSMILAVMCLFVPCLEHFTEHFN
jgi:hypothetical protein